MEFWYNKEEFGVIVLLEKFFLPDTYAENVFHIDLQALKNKGIKLILCDIDNTLVAHDDPHPDHNARAFMKCAEDAGMELFLISNNTQKRVSGFADKCGAKYYYSSLKPLKRQYKRILRDTGFHAGEVAVIGDQLLTDILGGKRMHFYTVLCAPLYTKDIIYTRITRLVENIVYAVLKKQGKLKRGEYYGEIL
ncbi:MAG: YqeG family HAD IIIA-type phosphatase [Erysipelotrichaceae bacterium]|nr:YqeG family HAD IIIA-type phosphatase [Erysipelotrichaceae bacterium]